MPGTAKDWMTSVEVRKALKVSTCDLSHLRESAAIRAEKRGNAFWYSAKDVDSLRGTKMKRGAGFCRLDDAHA
jgi:hypothetical protein